MSELIETRNNTNAFRWSLLASVSAAALIATSCNTKAADEDADRPTVWIELGGQLERLGGQGENFNPPFLAANASTPVFNPVSPGDVARAPGYAVGEEAKISFEPQNTDWVFSASVLYGRSGKRKFLHHQTFPLFPPSFTSWIPGNYGLPSLFMANFAQTTARTGESHAVIDFQAGRDVGIGVFGSRGTSVISAGLRFAQFHSTGHATMMVRPDLQIYPDPYGFHFPAQQGNVYNLNGEYERSFRGVGPSLSWDGSAAMLGHSQTMEMSLNWGVKAAILFGRQKSQNTHQTTSRKEFEKYYNHVVNGRYLTNYKTGKSNSRSRTIIVPNFGGFAALSFQHSGAKVSFGYRAVFFFGAIDGGIDARKSETTRFCGPYATISIGLGG